MKIPARRYQITLLCLLLVLPCFTIYAHKALDATRGSQASLLERLLGGPAATRPVPKSNPKAGGTHATTHVTATSAAAATNDFFTAPDEPFEPALASAQAGGSFNITQAVLSGGGGTSTGGNNGLTGTIGQGLTGNSTGGNFAVAGGFFGGGAGGGCPTITVTPPSTTTGTAGVNFSQQFTQTGGSGTVNFTKTGILPTGLTLATSGLLSGTPTQIGTFPITVTATDANQCTGTANYTLTINCPTITVSPLNPTLTAGAMGTFYSQTFTQSGSNGTITWSNPSGGLPNGLALNAASGVLSGTPLVQGNFNFTIRATDANQCTGERQYTLVINPMACPTITVNPTNSTLTAGTVGTTYSQTFTQGGGNGTITWSNPAGGLPGGLTLNSSSGGLSGTPTAQGTFNFTIRATDANQCTGERQYTLTINPAGNGLQFYPLPAPIRLLETRPGQLGCDTPGQPVTGQVPRTQQARVTCGGVTIPANAQAIAGIFTVVNQLNNFGYGTLYPAGGAVPNTANLNYTPQGVAFNSFITGLNAAGQFNIFAFSTVDVVIDVTGYFAPPGAGGLYYHSLPQPIRLLETRAGQQGCDTPGQPITGQVPRTEQARVTCGGITIPQAAQAITGSFTVVNTLNNFGYGTLYPAGGSAPNTANLNYVPQGVAFNSFITGLNGFGQFNVFTFSTVHAIIDVDGYFSPEAVDANGAGLLYTPLSSPIRLLETRAGQLGCDTPGAPLPGQVPRTELARVTCGGVTIPANAQAIAGIFTVVNQLNNFGYGNVYPTGGAVPNTANLNYVPFGVAFSSFITGLNGSGQFNLFVFSTVHVIIDVAGYFAP